MILLDFLFIIFLPITLIVGMFVSLIAYMGSEEHNLDPFIECVGWTAICGFVTCIFFMFHQPTMVVMMDVKVSNFMNKIPFITGVATIIYIIGLNKRGYDDNSAYYNGSRYVDRHWYNTEHTFRIKESGYDAIVRFSRMIDRAKPSGTSQSFRFKNEMSPWLKNSEWLNSLAEYIGEKDYKILIEKDYITVKKESFVQTKKISLKEKL